ncbi:MAG: MBL fold metallo-hydrolase [Cytophagaceae bacterium]|nr:MBL fold metallo-hydrolase [Cytophagaceae bacterium]MBK9936196.1 MBL fold metallo-hydrolase [Cytophagaceae bacterium]MBL0303914.1 MBL fold metallo-hydrolase [Cytophagaceae bacterium]MBL0326727.1 MBL fold metallo-hydrolase [Cytophagaceae bacterium]
MKVEQMYTGCLAEAAYYIESNGEVAIVDPLREPDPYIQKAASEGAKIKYILETHFHADFVSGHLELAAKTGATIVFGPTAQPGYAALVAKDEEELQLGDIKIKVLHTPGHTMESCCFLVKDEKDKDYGIITGDTLFIGDVGRPDLAIKGNVTQEVLAGYLYDSLHNKILTLDDDVIVFPGHGAGSACGKNMSKETTDSLGNQKKTNYALQAKTRDEFIDKVLTGLVAPPQYFPKNAVLNKMGYGKIDDVYEKGLKGLNPLEFKTAAEETNALVLDLRAAQEFCKGFIPNSWNIGLEGSFASWAGTLITDLEQPILLVGEESKIKEAITRLSRVGYDNTLGYLIGGIAAWQADGNEVETITSISASEFAETFHKNPEINVLDSRKKSEYDSEHVVGVSNFPLDFVHQNLAELDPEKTYYIHCASGYRSMVISSILKSKGYNNLIEIAGGFKAIKETGKLELTDYICPTTLL